MRPARWPAPAWGPGPPVGDSMCWRGRGVGVDGGGGRGGSIYRGLEQNDIEVCVSWIEDTEEKRKEKNRDIYG